jgi:hypothetical protein
LRPQLPELTLKPAVKLNERVSLRHHSRALSIAAADMLRNNRSTGQAVIQFVNLFAEKIAADFAERSK